MPVRVAKPEISVVKPLKIEDLRPSQQKKGPSPSEISHLFDPNHELDHFYEALLNKGNDGVVRVVHFGDSPTTADLVTGDVRAMLQQDFGDAGTGFALIAKPWAWYNHRGLDMSASKWKIEIAGNSGSTRDGWFGLGGVTFTGTADTEAHWTLKDGEHRHAEVSYLARPNGGTFAFEADGQEVGQTDTASEEITSGFASFDLPEGSTKFTLRVVSGQVRLFGVEFRKGAGVLYSSLGVNGAGVTMISRNFSTANLSAQLRHYAPDLVVLAYGTNESGYPKYVDSSWGDELHKAINRVREALPDTSILLMSPMDRGELNSTGDIVTTPALMRLVGREAMVAQESGTAFFNTFDAMGGEGTMGRWYAAQPRIVGADYIHPLPAGGKIVGGLLYHGLQTGFQEYKLRKLGEKFNQTVSAGPETGTKGATERTEPEKSKPQPAKEKRRPKHRAKSSATSVTKTGSGVEKQGVEKQGVTQE
jgi:lysophospholipase L1-like esterase